MIPLTDAIRRLEDKGFLIGGDLRLYDGDIAKEAHRAVTQLSQKDRAWAEKFAREAKGFLEGRSASGKAAQFLITSVGAAASGIPLWIPLHWARAVAEGVTNHSRMVNFLGNMNRYGDWDIASRHVEKYLFDYADMTGTNRRILRNLIPFWTFSYKNMVLQADILINQPYLYSAYDSIFHDLSPIMSEAMAAEAEKRPFIQPTFTGEDLESIPDYMLPFSTQHVPGSDNVRVMKIRSGEEASAELAALGIDFAIGAKSLYQS